MPMSGSASSARSRTGSSRVTFGVRRERRACGWRIANQPIRPRPQISFAQNKVILSRGLLPYYCRIVGISSTSRASRHAYRHTRGREEHMARTLLLSGLASAALAVGGAALAADIPEACSSTKAAVTGGPLPPPESDTVVIRWLGNANFAFAYKGKVYLFDAYFDRTPRSHAIGFKAADVSKAEAIFVSHAHFDHISDIGPVARQTGAPVVGAPITADTARKLGAPDKQIVVAKGGETMKFGDATVEIALAQHSTIQPGLTDIYAALYANDSPPYSDAEKAELARVRSLGTFDPKVITEGTLAYGLVFP